MGWSQDPRFPFTEWESHFSSEAASTATCWTLESESIMPWFTFQFVSSVIPDVIRLVHLFIPSRTQHPQTLVQD